MKFDATTEIFNEQLMKFIAVARMPVPPQIQLSAMFSSLLMTGMPDERPSAEVKAKRFSLLCKISSAVDTASFIDLNVDELSIITQLVDANCPTMVHGRMKEILNSPINTGGAV